MTDSLIVDPAAATAEENKPHPFVNADNGSAWNSWSEGALWDDMAKEGCEALPRAGSAGADPNPTYFPPVTHGAGLRGRGRSMSISRVDRLVTHWAKGTRLD